MIIRYAVLSQDLVYNVGSLTCWCIADSFRSSDTVSCHLVQNLLGKKKVLFTVLEIDVYLCHQHIVFKYPNSLESPLPAPLQHRRKRKIRAAGNAKTHIHSFIHSVTLIHAPRRAEGDARRAVPSAGCCPGTEPGCTSGALRTRLPKSAQTARIITKGCFSRQVISPWRTLSKGKLTAMVTAIFTNSLHQEW